MLIILICSNVAAQKPLRFSSPTTPSQISSVNYFKDKTSIKHSIQNFEKNALFTKKDKHIGYTLRLENMLKEEQLGNIIMQISSSSGVLYKEVYPFKIKKRGSYNKEYVFDANQLQPGFYVSSLNVLTDRYSDTIIHSFGYESDKVYVKNNPPATLVNYWDQAQRDLANTPANFNITPRPDLVNKFCDAYEVEFNSTEKAVIYGWLTMPKNSKNTPVLYQVSDYMSELKPEYRRDVAVLSINTRGTAASNTNYNYSYTDLGLLNIKDKNKYVLKGIYLDAFRGLDFITKFATKLNLDTKRIVISGNGLGASISVILAALKPDLKGIILESPSFIDMRNMINYGEGMVNATFPASMYKSFYSSQKNSKEAMLNTLDFFDPVFFAQYVSCPVLTGFGLKNLSTPASCVYNFLNQLRVTKKDKYICKECETSMDRGFYGFKETWLKEKFGRP